MENERSVQVADRCVKSGLVFGYKINKHKAYTPQNCDVYEELKKLKNKLRMQNMSFIWQ